MSELYKQVSCKIDTQEDKPNIKRKVEEGDNHPTEKRKCNVIDVDVNAGCRLVFYDLQTTGIAHHNKHINIEIVEICAVDIVTKNIFRQYIIPPSKNIPIETSKVHGIYLKEGDLYRNDEKLEAEEDLKKGLLNFLSWMKSFNKPIILSGYNNHAYDDWIFCHNLLREEMSIKDGGCCIIYPSFKKEGYLHCFYIKKFQKLSKNQLRIK